MSFHVPQKVLFKHCDPAGIVFYPRYFEMINDAVEIFFDEVIGMPYEDMHETHGVPTVDIRTRFTAASRHGDMLDMSVTPTRIGGSSLDLNVTATCKGQERFNADLTLVYVSLDMKSTQWPDDARAALQGAAAPHMKEAANG